MELDLPPLGGPFVGVFEGFGVSLGFSEWYLLVEEGGGGFGLLVGPFGGSSEDSFGEPFVGFGFSLGSCS